MEAALKPLKSPPLARVWTRGRWKRGGGVVVVSGVVGVLSVVVSFRSGGEVSNLSGDGGHIS